MDKKRFTKISPKSHEEWLEERKKGIGSSEVGTILGVNHFDTPYKLWRRKKELDPPVEETLIMRLGHLMEDSVATLFAEDSGAAIIKNTSGDWIAADKERPYLRVSPDRLYVPKGMKRTTSNYRVLECKTTRLNIDKNDINSIPKYWWCQVQYQLYVLGCQYGTLAWIRNGTEFDYMEIERNDRFCEFMLEKLDAFWKLNILANEEPVSINAEDTQSRFPESNDDVVKVDSHSETYHKWQQLREVRAEFAKIEAQKKQLEDQLKMIIGANSGIILDDEGYEPTMLATWKSPTKMSTTFDKDKFASDHPDLFKLYQKQSYSSRRFIFKD